MASPPLAAQYRDQLDRWVKAQEARRLAFAYAALAKRLKTALQSGGIPKLLTEYDAIMQQLVKERTGLLQEALTKAEAQATAAFQSVIKDTYGTQLYRQLMEPPPGSTIPPVLQRLGKGSPAAAQRVVSLQQTLGYSYSSNLWKSDVKTRQEMQVFLQNHLTLGQGAIKQASDFAKFAANDPTLPLHLKRLETTARQALQGAPGAKDSFLAALKQAKQEIEQRKKGPLGVQGIQKKTVQRLQRAVKEGSQGVLDSAIDQFIQGRARYRATVVLRSEANRAFQETSLAQYAEQDFVSAVKWNLSKQHTASHVDECDVKANADIGLGPGIYYKDKVPWPDHPNGLCYLTPVLVEPEQVGTAKPPKPPPQADQAVALIKGPLSKQANTLASLGVTDQAEQGLKGLLTQVPEAKPLAEELPIVQQPKAPTEWAVPPHWQLKPPETPPAPGPLKPPEPAPVLKVPLPPPPKAPLALDSLQKTGGQLGSVPGGQYQEPTTGEEYYVKFVKSTAHARNEMLANQLYKLAGLQVPELRYVTHEGGQAIASRWVTDLKKEPDALKLGTPLAADGFGVDAWLANWDVIGLEYDNLVFRQGMPFRVDAGGSLLYRAQGTAKGDAFGDTVGEIQTLRDPAKNPQAAAVFGKMTPAQLEASVRRVLDLDETAIRQLVSDYGPGNANARTALADRLLARQADLARQFPQAKPARPTPLPGEGQPVQVPESTPAAPVVPTPLPGVTQPPYMTVGSQAEAVQRQTQATAYYVALLKLPASPRQKSLVTTTRQAQKHWDQQVALFKKLPKAQPPPAPSLPPVPVQPKGALPEAEPTRPGIYPEYDNRDERVRLQKAREPVFDEYRKQLWPEAEMAIGHYKGAGYRPMNTAARRKRKRGAPAEYVVKPTLRQHIHELDEAIDRAPATDRNMIVYRGAKIPALARKFKAGKLVPGMIVDDQAFVSTSMDRRTSLSFYRPDTAGGRTSGLLFRIRLPQGSKALYYDALQKHTYEDEFLLPRGAQFRVLSSRVERLEHHGQPWDIRVVEVEYVGPPDEKPILATRLHILAARMRALTWRLAYG